MWKLIAVGVTLVTSGCAQQQGSLRAAWTYGTGVGDGAQYDGPKPVYSRNAVGANDEAVSVGAPIKERYAVGGIDGEAQTYLQPNAKAQP